MAGLLDAPLFVGLLLSWSLAAPPGPVNALMADASARRGFWGGWWIGAGAVLGDMTMLALTLLGVLRIVDALPWLRVAFAALGMVLMLWFAVAAWRAARTGGGTSEGLRGTFAKSYVIVVTSPFNWAWWLTAGSSMLTLLGWSVALGFFVGLVLWIGAWSWLATTGARIRGFTALVGYAAAVTLVVFAGLMAWTAATGARALLA